MDPYTTGYMIFTLIMVLLIGGFVVTFPVLRRLGRLLEEHIRDRSENRLDRGELARIQEDLSRIDETLETFRHQLELTRERQDFVEELMARPAARRLESGAGARPPDASAAE